MNDKRPAWPDLPIAFGAAVMSIGALLLLAQLALGAIAHGKKMKLSSALIGVVQPDSVPFSLAAFLNGTFQASFAHHIGTVEPYYPTAVRLRNQIEYSVFGMAAEPDIIVGRKRELIETGYVQDYCTRDLASFLATAQAAAAALRQIQTMVEQRGQTFLYVVTPSKIAQYPEFLPAGMLCPSSQASRTGIVPAWTALVRQAGVHLVDTTSILSAAHGAYPFPLFPRGGIHWNQVGNALAAQAIEGALQAQRRDGVFTPFTFTWKIASPPRPVDIDLATLMNLFTVPDRSGLPKVTMAQARPPSVCKTLNIVIIGGSFIQQVGAPLSLLPCRPHVVEYFYWQRYRIVWHDGLQTLGPADPQRRDAELEAADVILLEENETIIGRSDHVPAFYNWLKSHKGD